MTEPIDPTQPASQTPVLSYRPPAEDVRRASPPIVCATAVGTALLVIGTIVLSVVLVFAATGNGWPLLIIPAVLISLIWVAMRLRRRGRGRSVAMGIWIGLGVGLLAQGICFVAASR